MVECHPVRTQSVHMLDLSPGLLCCSSATQGQCWPHYRTDQSILAISPGAGWDLVVMKGPEGFSFFFINYMYIDNLL